MTDEHGDHVMCEQCGYHPAVETILVVEDPEEWADVCVHCLTTKAEEERKRGGRVVRG